MRHTNETEADYEKRLHVEAEYEIAMLLGEEPHARSRENVAVLQAYTTVNRLPMESLGWWRDMAQNKWRHESGAVIECYELSMSVSRNEWYRLAAHRIQTAMNKKAWAKGPLTPREIDALASAPPETQP